MDLINTESLTHLKRTASKNIFYIRSEILKLTLVKMSHLIGISHFSLKSWESGESLPEIETMQKVLRNGINLNFLLYLKGCFLLPQTKPDVTKKGHRISCYRRDKGFHEIELAYLAGIKTFDLLKIELIKKEPTDQQLRRISLALDVPYSHLRDEDKQGSIIKENSDSRKNQIEILKAEGIQRTDELQLLQKADETKQQIIEPQQKTLTELESK